MKKAIALMFIALMILSLCVPAFSEGRTETWNDMGFALTYTEAFDDTKGIYMPIPYPTVQDGIYSMMFNYCAFSKDESDAFNEKAKSGGLSEEDTNRIIDAMGTLMIVMGIDGGRGGEALMEALEIDGAEADALTQVGQCGDITYYALTAPEIYSDYVEKIPEEYSEEFLALQSELIEVLKNAEYFTPHSASSDLMGTSLRFETVDLDGNAVDSDALFAAHAVTMVNIWATWCGPCKSEISELGALARAIEADGKDAAVVGICIDADQEADLCREILAERDADYLNLLPYEGMLEALNVNKIPTTLFVNREGVILLPPIQGVPEDLSRYGELIDAFLGSDTAEVSADPEPVVVNDAQVYRVFVIDGEGNPLEGAMIQLCDDTSCTMANTNAEGIAEFAVQEGVYTVHVLQAPEGFAGIEAEYTTPETYSDVHIALQKAA